jgi:hypothetical protein
MSDSVLSAAKDLIKYRIIQYVNTGDKTYDTLLQGVYLAILTAIFSVLSFDLVKVWIMRIMYVFQKSHSNSIISQEIAKFHNDRIVADTSKIVTCTWRNIDTIECDLFIKKFKCYVGSKISWIVKETRTFNVKTLEYDGTSSGISNSLSYFRSYFSKSDSFNYVPLLIRNGKVAGITYYDGDILCFGETEEILSTLLKEIRDYPLYDPNTKSKSFSANISIHGSNKLYELFPDRTMDVFISKHKPRILQLLENFQAVNSGVSKYNGFGSYNLGFMVHGKPGTGKTFFIKAVCNYLRRGALIIDMRTIKNKKDLESIFMSEDTVKNKVIIFDEFDCVQDVVRDRSDTAVNTACKNTKLTELHARHMELLRIASRSSITESKKSTKSTKSTKSSSDDDSDTSSDSLISKQISKIEGEISDEENSLTLYTLLTLLDGMIEMRGRVIIATTNYLDRIDSALLREGRFDMKLNLDAFDDAEAHELLHKMFDSIATEEQLKRLADTQIKPNMYTPAQIVNLVLSLNDLDAVLDVIKK